MRYLYFRFDIEYITNLFKKKKKKNFLMKMQLHTYKRCTTIFVVCALTVLILSLGLDNSS